MKYDMSFLDYLFTTSKDEKSKYPDKTITVSSEPDGTVEVDQSSVGLSHNNVNFNLVEIPQQEQDAIQEYRRLALNAEVSEAIQEIVNESFNISNTRKAIELTFTPEANIGTKLQKQIQDEYNIVYHDLFDFDKNGAYLFRKFYIDSRLFIHKVVNQKEKRIQKLQVIDPLLIRRVRISNVEHTTGLVDLSKEKIVYFHTPSMKNVHDLWTGNYGAKLKSNIVIRFEDSAITYIDSGLVHPEHGYIIGHLSKAIIPYNNMKMMEDSMVIYRVVRSPARRVFYVDVGDMPKSKGENFIQQTMERFKNRLVYDTNTGSIANRRNTMSMLEDIYLPRSNGRSTEVTMLDEGRNVGETDDVEYCRSVFYRSLNVPKSRFDDNANNPFNAGRVVDVTRDEYRFYKFIQSLRNKFVEMIEDVLRTQLELKNIITPGDRQQWDEVRRAFSWTFSEDNQFVELKQHEILSNRLSILEQVDRFEDGRYFTNDWILRNVLKFNDSEIEELSTHQKSKEQDDDDIH